MTVDHLDFNIPRRRRGGKIAVNEKPRVPAVFFKNSLKRCFDQTQNSVQERQEIVRKPPKMLKKTKKIVSSPPPPPPLPQMGLDPIELPRPQLTPQVIREYIQSINGTDLLLVMEKDITESDLSRQHNRLSIPRNKIMVDFLNAEEHNALDAKQGINVSVIQPCRENITLDLKKWMMNNTYCYNLIGSWYKGVVMNSANHLRKGCIIQLWRFRRDSKLCFALVKK